MVLTKSQARVFYDRFGKKQDSQAFYEDPALDQVVAHARFEHAKSVFEFGCGTGRFARRLLDHCLSPTATYFGIDFSSTMIRIAQERIAPYRQRAQVALSDGSIHFEIQPHSVDRVISTYVFDLLSHAEIADALAEFRRILIPDGLVCLANFTSGSSPSSRILPALWTILYRLRPSIVGGCRPIRLAPFFEHQTWSLRYNQIISRFGMPSEVTIASPTPST